MARRALLIGINRYAVPGADLRGCVNDVRNMQRVLKRYHGFTDPNITVLTDARATMSAMMRAMRTLVDSGRRGDVLFLHYSGHGSNVPDASGDEADRRDEILCPTDLDWKKPLTDDWLRTTFDRLRAGVNLTVVMDCCHSGTNTRAIAPPDVPIKERYLPNPLDLLAVESGRKLRGTVQSTRRPKQKRRAVASDIVHADMPELLITGCRSTQTSADAYISGSFNGALTYHLAAVLDEARGDLSYRDLHKATAQKLRRADFSQVPQLEGRRTQFDRPFLSPVE